MIYAFSRWKDYRGRRRKEELTRKSEAEEARGFSKVRGERPLLVGFCDSLGHFEYSPGSVETRRILASPNRLFPGRDSSFVKILEEKVYGRILARGSNQPFLLSLSPQVRKKVSKQVSK